MNDDIRALLHDFRSYVLATKSLVEIEAQQRPERRTGHLALQAKDLIQRVDKLIPKGELDAGDGED